MPGQQSQGAPGQVRPGGPGPGQRQDAPPGSSGTSAQPKRPDGPVTERLGGQTRQASTQRLSEESGKATEKLAAGSTAAAGLKGGAGEKDETTGADAPGKAERVRTAEQAERIAGRRSRAVKLALLALGLIGVLVAFVLQRQEPTQTNQNAGRTAPAATASPATVAKIGEEVEKVNLSATVIGVNRNFTHPDPAIKPAPGNRFVVVQFKLTNKAPKAVRVSAGRQFTLTDAEKTKYEVSPIGAPDPKFPDTTLASGQTVSGWIAFQVPEGAKGLRLSFNPRVPV